MRMKWGIILSSAIVFAVVLVLAWGQVISRLPMALVVPAPDHQQAQALEALQSLRSVTQVGVSYSNYSDRVADTAIIVDRYLTHAHAPEQHNVRIAMAAYRLAMEGWGDTIRGGFAYHLAREAQQYPALASCLGLREDGVLPEYGTLVDGGKILHRQGEAVASLMLARNAPEPEWRCAEVFLDAAEKSTK